jgi:hypothetical protein
LAHPNRWAGGNFLLGEALAALRPPLILATLHIGAFPALAAVLERLDGDVIAVHRGRFAPRAGMTLFPGEISIRTTEIIKRWERL